MPEVNFTYKIPPKSIGGFVIDVVLVESYSFSNTVTDIPVEEGDTIADHVVENPDVIKIEAFIGSTSFESYGSYESIKKALVPDGVTIEDTAAHVREDRKNHIIAAYHELLRLKQEKQPVNVVLGLDSFPDMIITSFNIDRDVKTGADLSFTMKFKRIKIVKSETVAIKADSAAGDQCADTANMGTVSTIQPTVNQNKEHWKRNVALNYRTQAEYKREWGTDYPN
jgi:hypothetical protein